LSLHHKDHHEYARDIGPRLDQYLEEKRDRPFEAALREGFMFFAFTYEDFGKEAKKNKELFPKLATMLVGLEDSLRGIWLGFAHLSPMTIAALTRIVLELRINFTYIVSSEDPALNADRFFRYAELQKLAHDESKPKKDRRLSESERKTLMSLCSEWIETKKDGTLRFIYDWWKADPALARASLRTLAAKVGLEKEYELIYSSTSLFVHGSPRMLKYGYGDDAGNIAPLGNPMTCKRIAFLGFRYAVMCLQRACEFFDVPFDAGANREWIGRMAAPTNRSGHLTR